MRERFPGRQALTPRPCLLYDSARNSGLRVGTHDVFSEFSDKAIRHWLNTTLSSDITHGHHLSGSSHSESGINDMYGLTDQAIRDLALVLLKR